jgi:hypothetical protein
MEEAFGIVTGLLPSVAALLTITWFPERAPFEEGAYPTLATKDL